MSPAHGQLDGDGNCVLGGLPPEFCADCRAGRTRTPRLQTPPAMGLKPDAPTFGELLDPVDEEADEQ